MTAFTVRAFEWFAGHGIAARRLMTDGALSYRRNGSLRERLAAHGILRDCNRRRPTAHSAANLRSAASQPPWAGQPAT